MIKMMMMILDLMRITCTSVSIIYYISISLSIIVIVVKILRMVSILDRNKPKQSPHDVLELDFLAWNANTCLAVSFLPVFSTDLHHPHFLGGLVNTHSTKCCITTKGLKFKGLEFWYVLLLFHKGSIGCCPTRPLVHGRSSEFGRTPWWWQSSCTRDLVSRCSRQWKAQRRCGVIAKLMLDVFQWKLYCPFNHHVSVENRSKLEANRGFVIPCCWSQWEWTSNHNHETC